MPSLKLFLTVASALFAALPVNAGRLADLNRDHYARKDTPRYGGEERDESSYRYLNADTQKYLVKHLPDVDYDIGEMYSGLMPLDPSNPNRALFFLWQPTVGKPVNEILIWLNGGPGCSSLIGFFQENGRFTWKPGTYKPTMNEYSWVNETNVLWVEQPVGTGFSIGKVTATTEEEIAQDFVKFFANWQKTFGIKNHKVFVAGESYAGRYVPYISAAILDQQNKEHFDLRGALVYDPCIGDFIYTQQEVPVVPFVKKNANLFNFNDTFMSELEALHASCGYEKLIDNYLQFPPPGNQPAHYLNYSTIGQCDVFDLIYEESLRNNPCFNIYEVNSMCPILSDSLSFPTTLFIDTYPTYFNRADVKKAIHAPEYVDWRVCSVKPVFKGGPKVKKRYTGGPEGEGDLSADPIQKVLPKVIEGTNRVLVGNGDFDMIIITEGTLLAIQNMTWNGKLGFQKKPSTPLSVPLPDLQYDPYFAQNSYPDFEFDSQGIMGIHHYERGLMYVETYQSGHEEPQYQPRASYRHLQWLLGRINHL